MNINTSIQSPNNSSRNGRAISMLVLHATAGRSASDIHELTDNNRPLKDRVSAHYYVLKNGVIFRLVDEDRAAWHAGISSWGNKNSEDIQLESIGIEMENLNNGIDPYPKEQMDAVVALSADIVSRYKITDQNVVRHMDIAPKRKTDPAGFDWSSFKRRISAQNPGSDVWAGWGNEIPLNKNWGIPQVWAQDDGNLGPPTTGETYIPVGNKMGVGVMMYIVQLFRYGAIVGLNNIKDSFKIVRGPKNKK